MQDTIWHVGPEDKILQLISLFLAVLIMTSMLFPACHLEYQ